MLPLPAHFDPGAVGEVWRVPYEERALEAEAWAQEHALRPAGTTRPHLPGRRGRPEHLLHPGLRAVRRRALGHRRGRRQPPPVRVPLPEPGRDHASRADARHAPGDAGLPRRLARRRRGRHPSPHADLCGGRGAGRWRFNAGSGGSLGLDPAYAERHLAHYTRALAERAGTRSRSGRTTRCSAGSGMRSSPRSRRRSSSTGSPAAPSRTSSRRAPAPHGALLGDRTGGHAGPGRRPARREEPPLLEKLFCVRRGRDRGAGEEPLRRLDDRRPPRLAVRSALPPRSTCSRTAPRPSSSPEWSTTRRGRCGVPPLCGGGHARRPLDRPDRELARDRHGESHVGLVKAFEFGRLHHLVTVPVTIGGVQTRFYDGLVGDAFLRRFAVTFDLARAQMILASCGTVS